MQIAVICRHSLIEPYRQTTKLSCLHVNDVTVMLACGVVNTEQKHLIGSETKTLLIHDEAVRRDVNDGGMSAPWRHRSAALMYLHRISTPTSVSSMPRGMGYVQDC